MKAIVASMALVWHGNLHALRVSSGPSARGSQYGLCLALGLPFTLISHSRDARC